MKYDFSRLDPFAFERLCAALIAAQGYRVRQFARPGAVDSGIDFLVEQEEELTWLVQVKLVRSGRMPISTLRSAVLDLQNGFTTVRAQKALLIVSVPISAQVKAQLPYLRGLEVWDATKLEALLDKYPEVRNAYATYLSSTETLDSLLNDKAPGADDHGENLLAQLASVPAGPKAWKRYEEICVKILTYGFSPQLRPPSVQSRSHDGLDRRDAIYPIGSGHPFWDGIKYQHSARMVVVEFKNYKMPIGQKEVESLQQYLMPTAMRSFGIICSRTQPSKPALKARRRAWMASNNLILFLSDLDLQEIVRARADDEDTSRILDSKMDEFFITLAP